MNEFIRNNDRNRVYKQTDKVIKFYEEKDKDDGFEKEKLVYEKMNGKTYMPKILEINEKSRKIEIEKLTAPNLYDYVMSNNKIPYYLLNSLKKIRLDLLENGFYDYGDFFKLDHIFIDKVSNSAETMGVRIIDFDRCDKINKDQYNCIKEKIEEDFDKLNKDKSKFDQTFGSCFTKDVIDDFFMNKDK